MIVVAELIADLARAGVPPELIGKVAQALSEREPVLVPDEAAERRRAADRDRKKEARLRKSADSADVRGQPPSPKEIPPTPPKEITPSPGTANAVPSKSGRATRLKADWKLPKAWGDEAVAEGMDPDEVRIQAEAMLNWSLSSKDGTKVDWHAMWRNWFRKALRERPAARGSPAPPPKAPQLADVFGMVGRKMANGHDGAAEESRGTGSAFPNLSLIASR